MQLHEKAAAARVRLAAYPVLGSTNAHALSLARGGEKGPLWITAERQTEGRGREGRSWVSETGNLHATLLLTAPAPMARWPQLSFVAALALHDALGEIAPALNRQLAIKWPNDLLLSAAKLGGILIEGESTAGEPVAIGIGVNCVSHPSFPDCPTTDLRAAGVPTSAAALFAALSKSMLARLVQWNRGEGFSNVRSDWLDRAMAIGQPISVRIPGGTVTGRFDSLDERGRLLLRLPDGRVSAISAGDVIIAAAPAHSCA
jgi:BirA family biotin operon repressor/biotin-[acetyl-CoA-carboxylase] ligase